MADTENNLLEGASSSEGAKEQETSDVSTEDVSQPLKPENNTAWVGAVKKESRQKGYDEGYKRAQEEFKKVFLEKSDQNEAVGSAQIPSQEMDNSSISNPSNPNVTALSQQLSQVDARGAAKYDGYIDKVEKYITNALESSQKGDPRHQQMMIMAAQLGGEDMCYQLASNPDLAENISQFHPAIWGRKMMEATNSSTSNGNNNGNPTIKVAAPPTSNLPKTSSYGNLGKMTSAQKRVKQKQKHR